MVRKICATYEGRRDIWNVALLDAEFMEGSELSEDISDAVQEVSNLEDKASVSEKMVQVLENSDTVSTEAIQLCNINLNVIKRSLGVRPVTLSIESATDLRFALEAEKGFLARIWDKIKAVFKWIKDKISAFFDWVIGFFKSDKSKKVSAVLDAAEKEIEQIVIEPSKDKQSVVLSVGYSGNSGAQNIRSAKKDVTDVVEKPVPESKPGSSVVSKGTAIKVLALKWYSEALKKQMVLDTAFVFEKYGELDNGLLKVSSQVVRQIEHLSEKEISNVEQFKNWCKELPFTQKTSRVLGDIGVKVQEKGDLFYIDSLKLSFKEIVATNLDVSIYSPQVVVDTSFERWGSFVEKAEKDLEKISGKTAITKSDIKNMKTMWDETNANLVKNLTGLQKNYADSGRATIPEQSLAKVEQFLNSDKLADAGIKTILLDCTRAFANYHKLPTSGLSGVIAETAAILNSIATVSEIITKSKKSYIVDKQNY